MYHSSLAYQLGRESFEGISFFGKSMFLHSKHKGTCSERYLCMCIEIAQHSNSSLEGTEEHSFSDSSHKSMNQCSKQSHWRTLQQQCMCIGEVTYSILGLAGRRGDQSGGALSPQSQLVGVRVHIVMLSEQFFPFLLLL